MSLVHPQPDASRCTPHDSRLPGWAESAAEAEALAGAVAAPWAAELSPGSSALEHGALVGGSPSPVHRSPSLAKELFTSNAGAEAYLAPGNVVAVVSEAPAHAVVVPAITLVGRPVWAEAAKRAIDIAGSIFGLILFSPVFLLGALLVRLTSRGPAFFAQMRCGRGGRKFRCFKFRTMVQDAEKRKSDILHRNELSGPVFKVRHDPRITRVGRVFRKFSIDELPQLWNVLVGDMSLVGPRPPTPDEVASYTSFQRRRLGVKPGMTGLWQVSGRSSIPDFNRWVQLDVEYIERWSLWMDIEILLKTLPAVISARGAY